ncbi:MAG: hypothetical protein NTW86_30375, partial [Candidatus Sumerlaeota bacterium]|nr:hypothetical protein [Candidatus Sumerlaeota bacterium]
MTFRSHRSSAFRSLWLAAWLVAVALVSFGATKSGPALPGETAPAPSPSAKPAAPPLTPEPAFGRNAPPASAKAAKAPTPTEEPAAAASQAASGPGEPGRATPARRASRPVSPSIATPRWSASREFPDFRIGY